MTVLKQGISARWWFSLAVLIALVCVGLAASSSLAAPTAGAPTGKPAAGQPPAGQPNSIKGDKIAPSVPLTCSNDYVATTSTGATIDPGTTLVTGSQTDDGVSTIGLPFTYYHYGTAYSTVRAGSNGNLQFVSSSTAFTNQCPLPYATFNEAIMPHWDDLLMTATCGAGCGIYTSTTGVSPNQIFNIEWRACLYNAGACGGNVGFEVRLYEALTPGGESQFEFVYGPILTNNGVSASVGVQKGTGAQLTTFSCNTASLSPGLKIYWTQNPCGGPTFTPTNTATITPTPTNTFPTFTPTITNTPVCEVNQSSTDVPKTINDNSTVTSTLNIPGTIGTLSDVDLVGLVISHTYVGDLIVSLTSPANTTVVLIGRVCGTTEDFSNVTIDDGAATAIGSNCTYPITGSYKPGGTGAGTLATFNGQNGSGTWTLTISDNATIDTGTLRAWSLRLRSSDPCPLETFTPTNTPTITQSNTPTISPTLTVSATPNNCGPGSYYFEAEPNNSLNDAMPLGSVANAQILGQISPIGDLDYYRFQATAGNRVWAYLYTQGATTSTDSQMYILNSAGQTVQFDDDGGSQASLSSGIAGVTITQTGTYYVEAKQFTNSSTVIPYNLYLDVRSASPTPIAETEPNDTVAQANPMSIGDTITGTIPITTDLDVFGFPVTAGDKLVIQVDGDPERDGVQFDPNFDVLDTAGNVLDSVDGSSVFGGGLVSESAVYTTTVFSTTAVYHVRVKSDTAPAGGSSTGTYNLHIFASPKLPCGNTPTPIPTNTATNTRTVTPTATIGSPTNTPTISATRTNTPTPTLSNTPTISPTPSPTVCAPSTIFTEGFESGLGQFSSQVPTCVPGGCGWVITTTSHSGVGAAFAPDNNNISDQILVSTNPIAIPASATLAELNFWHQYTFENATTAYDGGVVEVSTDGGANWITNTTFMQNGYNATLSTCCANPLAGRPAFGNSSGGYINSRMNLAAYAGQNILVRFREGTDSSIASTGWYIDDVTVVMDAPCTGQLVVHVTWQGIPQPNSRNTTETVTATLRLTGGGPATEYTGYTTDASGFFTLPVGGLPNGTYVIRVKGPRNLSNGTGACTQTVTLTGAPVTQYEAGTMRAGDAVSVGPTNFNVVNSTDFTTLKATFGKSFGQPGYDARADFDNNDVVNSTDFTLLKGNFGQAGCGPGVDPEGASKSEDSGSPSKTDSPTDAPPGVGDK